MYNNRISPEPDPEQSRTRSGSADLSIHSSLGSFTADNSEDKTDTGQRSLQGERSPQGQSQNDTEQNQGSGMSQHSEEKPGGESEKHVGGISWEQNLSRSDDQGDNSGEMELTPGDYREIDNNSRLSDIDDKTALILPDESVIYKDKKSHLDSPKVTLAVKKQLNEEAELFEMQTTDSNLQRETEKKIYLEAAEKKTQPESDLRHRRHGDIKEKTSYHEVIIGGGGEEGEGEIGCCGWILTILSFMIVVLTLPFSMFFCIKVVQEYERAVIFRLGRLLSGGAKGPGIFFILPCIESYTKVDLRTVSFDVPPQEILTRDSVTVSVDAVVYYRVSNPTVSVANVENAHHATRLLAQTTLRNILGTKNMSEILTERETISNAMQSVLDGATDRWGIKVERVEIKDVRLPLQLQRAMAAEAEASREARAKVLAAEGEHLASRSLKEAADMISQSPAAIQLRYLQTLNSISAEKNSTIIFPLPIDLIKSFMGGDFNKKSNSKSSTTIM